MPLNGIADQHQIFNSQDLNITLSGSRYIPLSPIKGTPAANIKDTAKIPAFSKKLKEKWHKYLFNKGGLNRFVLITHKRNALKFWL
jgi:hypothetical protein